MENQIEIIKQYKTFIVASINKILDKKNFLQENLEKFPNKKEVDGKVVDYIEGLKSFEEQFEPIRKKLLADDFNLSSLEISYCGLALGYAHEEFYANKIQLETGMKLTMEIGKNLLGDGFEELLNNFRKFAP